MKNSKTKIGFFAITCSALVIFSIMFMIRDGSEKRKTAFIDVVPGGSKLYIEDDDLVINGWDSYGVTYFFIPSYAKITDISYERSNLKIYDMDGKLYEKPLFNTDQEVMVDSENGQKIPYKIGVYQSNSIRTINIVTPNNDLDELRTDNYISISINMISPTGILEFVDEKATMKGRGNSTWEMVLKKSYEIKLSKEYSLLNETKSDKWELLANAIDNTKICNKMVLDTAVDIGMPYISESEWADVYINGLYYGNYLLCKEPHISSDDIDIGNLQKENKQFFFEPKPYEGSDMFCYDYPEEVQDISGGYLLSVGELYRGRNCGFYLPDGVSFYLKSPDNASVRETEYISSYIREIDSNIDKKPKNIDYFSFARRFLIDEVFFEDDSRTESYFFYKKKGLDMLYAGPCWDYDRLFIWMGPIETAAGKTILDEQGALPWDIILMKNTDYSTYVREVFLENADLWNKVLNERIDRYSNLTQDSIEMDYARWSRINDEAGVKNYGYYCLPKSNIKFMKYSLYKRLCYLADRWDLDYEFTAPKINDETIHRVAFSTGDGVKEISVKDGGFISNDQLLQMNLSTEDGWINRKTKKDFSVEYPVYEDAEYIN